MKDKKKCLLLAVLVLVFPVLCAGCTRNTGETLYEKQLLYFDTIISLKFYAGENGGELMNHCEALCKEYEKIFSRTDEGSELYAVNHRSQNTVEISPELAELIAVGLDYYKQSQGKFDITIAPLSDLWDFKSEHPAVPAEDAIRKAAACVGADGITLTGQTLTFASADTMIDLGALAKGYAADHLKSYLTENGVTSGLLNLGGNVLAIGSRPDGSDWKIGIKKPFDKADALADTVSISDKTVVSSGIYERYFEQDGTIYHHILDPDTGYPIQNDIWGVSILCDSSLTGDALSTTCLTLGYEKASEFLSSLDGVEAVFVLSGGEVKRTFSQ